MLARISWGMAGATLVLVVVDAVLTAQYRSLTSEGAVAVHGFPFVDGAVLGCAVMGAIVVSRYERHVIGWLLTLIGTTTAISLVTEAWAVWVIDEDGPGTRAVAGWAAWVSTLLGGQLAIAGLALLFLLAPDGRLLSRRWRYAVVVLALGELSCVTALLTIDPTTFQVSTTSDAVGALQSVLFSVGFLLITGVLIAALVSMLVRLHRSRGEARQQVRLIALAAAGMCVGLAVLAVVQGVNGGRQTWAASLPLFVSYLLLPILLAVAVLRYRLYDIEVIINRTVVLAVGTAFAAVGYTTLVVVVGKLVDRQTSGYWLSLSATALVALAFQPLRRRVVHLANRLAYGSRAQPYRELSDFSKRLGETPSPETLLPVVAAAAGQALSARRVTVRLDVPGAPTSTAVWERGSLTGLTSHIARVRTGGAALGSIEVEIPKGRHLRPSDRRLLEALADQAAVAFRNAALEIQLAGQVAELDRTARELGEARARIIEADDTVRRTLETAISREVLPHLVQVAGELAVVADAGDAPAEAGRIAGLVAGVNAALESLRDLTRGVFPTQLERSGLGPALRSLVARSGLPTTLDVDPAVDGRRFSPRVEAALYFCCAEALRGDPGPATIDLAITGEELVLHIGGSGSGRVGVQGIVDRAAAVGGSLVVRDGGLTLEVPVGLGDLPVPAGAGPHG